MRFISLIAACLIAGPPALGRVAALQGFDISVPVSAQNLTCLQQEHAMVFAVPRVYRCIGQVDHTGVETMVLARAQSNPPFKFVDGYIFPCAAAAPYNVANNISCPSAAAQVEDTLAALAAAGIRPPGLRLWLDIEDEVPSKYYSPEVAANVPFLQAVTDALLQAGVDVGVYTTATYWKNIMGNAQGWGGYPLWYPRYDGTNSMDFFAPFADFAKVYAKQTAGDTALCGTEIDLDYME